MGMRKVVIKVTYFDYAGVGTLGISTDGCRTTISTQPTSEDRTLKTATFAVETLPLSETEALTDFDFEVCGFDANGAPQEIIVSFVRVIKANPRRLQESQSRRRAMTTRIWHEDLPPVL